MTVLRLGVDLGGTKTEAVVLQLKSDPGARPDVLARVRIPTERDRGYAHIVEHTRALVAKVAREAGLTRLPPIGVGMPGSIRLRDGASVVKNSNTTVLNGQPFRADLERAIGQPVAFANDANCFALAEATFGAATNARVVFGVIMGTGVGGGIALRDGSAAQGAGDLRVWDGAQGIAGEWGHVVLDPENGPPCYCGKRGCVEQYLSGPAIERAHLTRTGETARLAELAARTDDAARTTIDHAIETFGRALATVLAVLDPEVVVLGGGVSNIGRLYDDGVRAVARWAFTDALQTRIVKNALGDSAGVFGAALLPIGSEGDRAYKSDP